MNPSINPLADFHRHWTAYEKAVALKDWDAAFKEIEGAIRACPIPGHLAYLSKERDGVVEKQTRWTFGGWLAGRKKPMPEGMR